MLDQLAPGKDLEVSVTLTDDDFMRELNLEHRRLDRTTDVLAFPLMSPEDIEALPRHGEFGPESIGDVVINLDAAHRQAAERCETLLEEARLLLAHGLLHLFGYDHETGPESETMRLAEVRLLGGSIIKAGTREG